MSRVRPSSLVPRRNPRPGGAALLALLLVAGTPVAATAGPSPEVASTASTRATQDLDTDGDGLADPLDGCPTVAAATVTGCPTAWRKVALSWRAGERRLLAQVSSPVPTCASRARVKLFLDRRSGPDKLLASDASYRGRHRFKVRRGRRYYVMVSTSYSSGVAECQKAVSRTVRVPR